jgi:hypothetical protein
MVCKQNKWIQMKSFGHLCLQNYYFGTSLELILLYDQSVKSWEFRIREIRCFDKCHVGLFRPNRISIVISLDTNNSNYSNLVLLIIITAYSQDRPFNCQCNCRIILICMITWSNKFISLSRDQTNLFHYHVIKQIYFMIMWSKQIYFMILWSNKLVLWSNKFIHYYGPLSPFTPSVVGCCPIKVSHVLS